MHGSVRCENCCKGRGCFFILTSFDMIDYSSHAQIVDVGLTDPTVWFIAICRVKRWLVWLMVMDTTVNFRLEAISAMPSTFMLIYRTRVLRITTHKHNPESQSISTSISINLIRTLGGSDLHATADSILTYSIYFNSPSITT
jgi:hypothetical protein